MTTVAESLADQLTHAGIEIVFGLPGGETVELLDAQSVADSASSLLTMKRQALFMADAYARLTGLPGVCLTTLDPARLTPSSASPTRFWNARRS